LLASQRCRGTIVLKYWRYIYCLSWVGWRFANGGRPSVQGADKRVKYYILKSSPRIISCVETAHSSSLHVSTMWFSCKLGSLIWGIGACTLFAPNGLQQAPWERLRVPTGEQFGLGLPFLIFFDLANQLRETHMSDFCFNPGK
jgi:hypothetical protein